MLVAGIVVCAPGSCSNAHFLEAFVCEQADLWCIVVESGITDWYSFATRSAICWRSRLHVWCAVPTGEALILYNIFGEFGKTVFVGSISIAADFVLNSCFCVLATHQQGLMALNSGSNNEESWWVCESVEIIRYVSLFNLYRGTRTCVLSSLGRYSSSGVYSSFGPVFSSPGPEPFCFARNMHSYSRQWAQENEGYTEVSWLSNKYGLWIYMELTISYPVNVRPFVRVTPPPSPTRYSAMIFIAQLYDVVLPWYHMVRVLWERVYTIAR